MRDVVRDQTQIQEQLRALARYQPIGDELRFVLKNQEFVAVVDQLQPAFHQPQDFALSACEILDTRRHDIPQRERETLREFPARNVQQDTQIVCAFKS